MRGAFLMRGGFSSSVRLSDELLQLPFCRAAFDEGARLLYAALDGVGLAADVDGGAGVQQHDVGLRALGAREDGARDSGVLFCRAADDGRLGGALDAEVLGSDRVRPVPAVLEFGDFRRCADGDLVEAVRPVDDHAASDAEVDEHAGQRLDEVFVVDAEDHALGTRGIRQGAEDVEDGADAKLPADGADVFHRGVILLREHEAQADLLEKLRAFFGCEADVDAERFEAVGGAALRRCRAVAVLGDGDAGGGDDEGGGRRDVDAACMVAARADDFEHFEAGMLDGESVLAHGGSGAGDFRRGLRLGALRRERGEVGGVLRGACLAAHDLVHHGVGFLIREVVLADDLLNGFFYHGIALLCSLMCLEGRENNA